MGGGSTPIKEAPTVGVPLSVTDIEVMARLYGVEGWDLFDVVNDVMQFDVVWLKIEYRRVRERLREMNRN